MENFIGKQIDQYHIIERLGVGGMAVVYKAYDIRLEREVALKLIRSEAIPGEQIDRLMKRFAREAKSQSSLDHKNIVHVYDYGEVDSLPYLVMNYIPGGTLKDRIHGPVEWRQAVQWLLPIAEALSYAHNQGVIHRDVKPANILFDGRDQPILSDFGIAKILETDENTLTGTGLGVGTPEYMAPEQWRGVSNEHTDQYALGVVLYELITGRKPYLADTPAAIAIQQATEPLVPPNKLVTGIPYNVEKLIYKALANDFQDRYKDMDTFVKALYDLLSVPDITTPSSLKQKITISPETFTSKENTHFDDDNITYDVITSPERDISKEFLENKTKEKTVLNFVLLVCAGIIGIALFTVGYWPSNNSINDLITTTMTPTDAPCSTPTLEETFNIGSTKVNETDNAVLVFVPSGEFTMGINKENLDWLLSLKSCEEIGCDREMFEDVMPSHIVYLDNYWIYKNEVTNAEFALFVEATDYITTAEKTNGSLVYSNYIWLPRDGANWLSPEGIDSNIITLDSYPVVHISWIDAKSYCEWAGGDLPSEAEWEKAARGEDAQLFPWGYQLPTGERTNYCDYNCPDNFLGTGQDDNFIFTAPTGTYPLGMSPYGALDMAGNVSEWVSDWYSENYYSESPYDNPRGPETGDMRIFRGGSWESIEFSLTGFYRQPISPNFSSDFLGFRCVIKDIP